LCVAAQASVSSCTATPTGYVKYGYGAAQNRTSVTTGFGTIAYGYNDVHQLCDVSVTTANCSGSTDYAYDLNGNQTKSPAFASLGYNAKDQNTGRDDGTTNRSFTYADAGQSERVTKRLTFSALRTKPRRISAAPTAPESACVRRRVSSTA
jgi:hypothetical protein